MPQLLLCGLFVARGPDGRLAAGDQRRPADDVRGRGAAGGRRARRPDRHAVAGPGHRGRLRGAWRSCWRRRPCAGVPPDRGTTGSCEASDRAPRDQAEGTQWYVPAGAPATRTPARRSWPPPARRSPSAATTGRRSAPSPTSAGVDPALVHHYFGTKDQLFLAAMQAPIDPASMLPTVLAGGLDGVGERLVRTLLSVWDSPAGAAAAALRAQRGQQRDDRADDARVPRHPDPAAGRARTWISIRPRARPRRTWSRRRWPG